MKLDEIAAYAKRAGLDGVAICDHDRVWTSGDLSGSQSPDSDPDFLIIPGVEISTEYGHLLGWFIYKPIETKNFAEAVEAIHAQNGVAVLAHPFEHTRSDIKIAPIARMLDGVEVWNGRAERKNKQANAMADAFAQKYNLRRFAGSDAHVPREIGNGVTEIEINIDINHINADKTAVLNEIRAVLLSGRTRTSGRRGRAVDVAASQFTRLKKSRAGWIACCKWAAFAVKCCLDDIFTGV